MHRAATPLLSVVLGACASAPTVVEPAGPPSLVYRMPADSAVSYLQIDTAVVSVDAGGQTIDVRVTSSMTLDLAFADDEGGGLRVSAGIRDLEAQASNPMGAPQTVREATLGDPLVFTLSPLGEGDLVSAPDISQEVRTFVSFPVIAATFFPRLPGRPVPAGSSWTDTVTVTTDDGDTSVESTTVMTYTAEGDSTVAGRSYLLVRMSGTDRRVISGSQMGMDMTQELSGTSGGWFLWDPSTGLPADMHYESTSSGEMEVSAAPFPMAIRAESTSHVRRLEEGGAGGGAP